MALLQQKWIVLKINEGVIDHVFVRFRLSDQFRSSEDTINDFGVVNIADPET
ncbi:hypothetical protein MTR_4g011740 [Medicago truncatula]|uniref:Uncharacterized protein n=1 Tax=Medicago truncatula TaxID=3880 RepID=A0A072UI02_MEDTR|nr:hypothetical protein MTR_4g011740 [Medicago truncatula]